MGKHTIDPQISAEHLAGAVRFATVSNADNSLTDYTKFDAFHEYLKETYPLVHKHLTLEHTGQAGLLYHWKGTGAADAFCGHVIGNSPCEAVCRCVEICFVS